MVDLSLTTKGPIFMAVPIVCFVGRSNSGKTTLIERVIPELVRAGYKVATVKHAGHGFDLDTEGKDSWRHKRAGASSVMVLSKGSMAMFADVSDQMNVEEVRDRFLDDTYDLIIAEGWKHEGYPKIVIVRDQIGEIPVSDGRAARGGIGQACGSHGAAVRAGRCRRRGGLDYEALPKIAVSCGAWAGNLSDHRSSSRCWCHRDRRCGHAYHESPDLLCQLPYHRALV